MKQLITWRTPVGDFSSIAQAVAALKCSRPNFLKRIESGQEGYAKIIRKVQPKIKEEPLIRGVRWPISWNQYKHQQWHVKEEIFENWMKLRGYTNADDQDVVDQFFDEMDQAFAVEDVDELDQEINDADDQS